MKNKSIIKKIDEKIFDTNIINPIMDFINEQVSFFNSEHSYEFEILFNPTIYDNVNFWEYPIDKNDKLHPVGDDLSNDTNQKNYIYQVLEKQLNLIYSRIKSCNIKLKSFDICGTNEVNETQIKVTESDELDFPFCCNSIIPDKQNIADEYDFENLARFLLPKIKEYFRNNNADIQ